MISVSSFLSVIVSFHRTVLKIVQSNTFLWTRNDQVDNMNNLLIVLTGNTGNYMKKIRKHCWEIEMIWIMDKLCIWMESGAIREMAIVHQIVVNLKIFLITVPMGKMATGLLGAFQHYSTFYLEEKSSKHYYEILQEQNKKKRQTYPTKC